MKTCKRGHLMDAENTILGADGGRRCRTCRRAADRAWDRAHPELARAQKRRSGRRRSARRKALGLPLVNPGPCAKCLTEPRLPSSVYCRECHRAYMRVAVLDWQRRNPVRSRAIRTTYRQTPGGRAQRRHDEARREIRKRGNGGTHTLAEWLDKLTLFAHCCAYCGEATLLTRDHKIPLHHGGTDDIANIVPACRPCNSAKGTRTAAEFLAR